MSFYCKKFQIRVWFWLVLVGLSVHFGYSLLGEEGDWFIKGCVAVFTGCAALWWLWMMKTFDNITSTPLYKCPELKDEECGNRHRHN